MKLEDVKEAVGDTPHMGVEQAVEIQQLISKYDVKDVLELGFCHGVSTCYIAAILESRGAGHIHSIDLEHQRTATPNAPDLLNRLGLAHRATLHFEPTSYTWKLMKMLEESPEPRFDFCYLDGAHSWFVDGLAFFLVERLLRPGGWIIFDDFNWTYAQSPSLSQTDFVRNMPDEEATTPQIKKVFELLVQPHPNFEEFDIRIPWAYARKSVNAGGEAATVKTIRYRELQRVGLGAAIQHAGKKLRGFFKS